MTEVDTSAEAVERNICSVMINQVGFGDYPDEKDAALLIGTARTLLAEREALKAENERLREALTPSGETKCAFMSEFSWTREITDENGDEATEELTVPWVTIKEIMAAIYNRAALKDGTIKTGSRAQGADPEGKPEDSSADNQEPVKNPEGFTEEMKAICAARCDDEAGEPPCYQLPELVEPCEHITPCAECKAEAKARAAVKGGDA